MIFLDKFLTLQQSLTALGVQNSHSDKDDTNLKIQVILKSCCELLNVSRTSLWLFSDNKQSIVCQYLYIKDEDKFEAGLELSELSYPHYFAALKTSRVINADNARTDYRTREFLDNYLTPLNIVSMLDAPIFKDGKLAGVLCIEQTSHVQQWDMAEISYSVSVADCISLIYAQSLWFSEKQRMRCMERVDPLTNLENRLFFQKRLNQDINSSVINNKCAVILIGLDDFTNINDRYSYSYANKILCKIARRLEKINYEVSFSLARVGGDVFAVWLPEIKNQTVLEDIISAIKLQLSHRFKTFTNEMINLSGSIGVFSGDVAEFRSKDPLRKAEIAMLKAKKSNKDSVCYFNPLWLFENQEEVLLEHDFIAALGSGQIIAFYQPIVQQDYQTAGFALEALVRWSHPTKGIITPNIILPIAKRLGLMEELGRTIFEQACSDTRLFISKGLNLKKVSINISSEQLFSPQLVEQIKHCLDTHQVSASLIEFEIVEELISGDFDILSKQMEKLTDLGINLSIDDFGTGYSSLSRLKHLNVSKLKIDKSFIDALPNDENDICIVKAIIGLAKGMNLLLVAEGVEEEEQATWLFENGCDCLQGYLISKPIKPKDIIELMAEPVDLFKKK